MSKRERTECSRVGIPTFNLQIAPSQRAMASQPDLAVASPTMFDKIINELPSTLVHQDEKGENSLANMSFQNLLAMAHAQVNKGELQNVLSDTGFAATSSGILHLNPPGPFTGSQITMSLVSSSLLYSQNSLGSKFQDEGSIPSGHLFNHNSLPSTLTEALSDLGMPAPFQPITPEKIDDRDETLHNILIGDGIMEPQDKEKCQMVFDQRSAAKSPQLQENHKPDKGGTEELDLIKTPQQPKPRRRKHRPKVIIEGQYKRTTRSTARLTTVPQENRAKRKYVRKKTTVSPSEGGTELNETAPDLMHKSSVETPTIPQETRAKRKYVRRKGINNHVEGGIDATDLSNSASDSVQMSGGKRKYVRKKGINTPGDNLDSSVTTDVGPCKRTRSSCKKSLNFTSEGQVSNDNSPCIPSSNYVMESQSENINTKDYSRENQCAQGIIQMMEKTGTVTSHECASSTTHLRESHTENLEQHSQSHSSATDLYPVKDRYLFTDQILCTKGKCQIVFSEATHEKETSVVHMRMTPTDDQWSPKDTSGSICSNTCVNLERHERILKSDKMPTNFIGEVSSRNDTGIYRNSLQKYHTVFSQNTDTSDGALGLDFAATYKKTRTEMGHTRMTSSLQYAASTSVNHMVFGRQNSGDSYTNFLASTSTTCGTESGRQVFENLLALGQAVGTKKRRSKDPSQLTEMHKGLPATPGRAATTFRVEQGIEILPGAPTYFEARIADTSTNVTTTKQTKRSTVASSTLQYNHQTSSTMSIAFNAGPPLAITWTSTPSIDSITKQLHQLDLNAKNQGLAHNALAAYNRYYQEHALVPFQGHGPVVPFNQVRRRRPRPKVDLDEETTRVWKLLLENINSEGIDGTDEQKAKWWEEERKVFGGRADSFIARMHLVQGDRRFSPWKGSVVDSVVGVFLTQNVSDHLSSSAFMSMAAQFPIGAKTNHVELNEKRQGISIKEPQVYEMDLHETFGLNKELTNSTAYGEAGQMFQGCKNDGTREVSSVKPAGESFDGFVSGEKFKGQSTGASKYSRSISQDTATKNSVSLTEDGRDSEDTLSSSQNSIESAVVQTTERSNSCSVSTSEQEATTGPKPDRFTNSTSFVKLLQEASTTLHGVYERGSNEKMPDVNCQGHPESLSSNLQNNGHVDNAPLPRKSVTSSSKSTSSHVINLGGLATECDLSHKTSETFNSSSKKEHCTAEMSGLTSESASQITFQKFMAVGFNEGLNLSCLNAQSIDSDHSEINQASEEPTDSLFQERIFHMQEVNQIYPQNKTNATGSSSNNDNLRNSERMEVNSNKNDTNYHAGKITESKAKEVKVRKEKEKVDWEPLRKQALADGRGKAKTTNAMDSVDWEAVRCADVNLIAQTIKERGMNNMLAERIKEFLNRLVNDHGSIDLEWLRDVPPDKAKEYLLSFRGLGLKSVECVRLLTLHHLAFPVDTNVGRIAVRLGWVPLQPLPESLQLHLLELYPVLESIQKYLWPRLCKLDQRTLYELHYQMITFGKVFCTKSKPNCNACPMRGECRHFASAFASARLPLPAPGEKSIVCASENKTANQSPWANTNNLQLPSPHTNQINFESRVGNSQPIIEEPATPEPAIEIPTTPESTYTQLSVCDIEKDFNEEHDEIPTIQLNMKEFTHNLQKIMQQSGELQEADLSKALVALTSEAASIPVPKLKNVNGLRTEHHVYELPDSHPLLEEMDKRELDDPCPYLLAIWTPGETVNSIEPPATRCSSEGYEKLCPDETCSACNSIREANTHTVRGTLLIPCRTAMRGSFPLNGTYFQVNEVFSDHESSLLPMDVPREWLWNLPRRTVYFGTSIPTIFKGLSTEQIQHCFWRGFVCVRGFDRKTRAPRPLIARLHFPASRLGKGKRKIDETINRPDLA